jgi:hypothetical protein
MNKFLPDDDRDLVSFLQQHRPLPPTNSHLESQIMDLVERQPRKIPPKSSKLWFIPGAIAMGLVITWNQRLLQPTPQLVRDNQNLELFLVDSWEATIEDTTISTTPESQVYQLLSTVESPQVITSTTFK